MAKPEAEAVPVEDDALADLAILTPDAATVEVGGRVLKLQSVRVGGLRGLMESCKPIMEWISAFNFAGAMVNAHDDAIHFLVVAAQVDQAFVESLTLAESDTLANAAMEANTDFFVQLLAGMSLPAPDEKGPNGEAGLTPLPD